MHAMQKRPLFFICTISERYNHTNIHIDVKVQKYILSPLFCESNASRSAANLARFSTAFYHPILQIDAFFVRRMQLHY